jgi:hypothetical protein
MKFSLNQYHLYSAGAMIGTGTFPIQADNLLNAEKSALLLIKNEIWQ